MIHFCRIEQKENHLFETEIYCNKLYCLFSFIYWILAEYLKKNFEWKCICILTQPFFISYANISFSIRFFTRIN